MKKNEKKPPIIGDSEDIRKIKELVRSLSSTNMNILITGETGVGKELIARNLYLSSPRANNAFVKVNCAALPETLLESELYGYEKGAFTGAHKSRQGKFRAADKGVLFLDEIGDMSLPLQSKMLHVLQAGGYSPIGSEREIHTDAWVIAATNNNLEEKIERKEFREDLYYRLNIMRIDIPPLRTRLEDVPPLIEHYLKIYSEIYSNIEFSMPDTRIMEKLTSYHWPGNARQLQNCIKKQLVLCDWDQVIDELFESNENFSESPSSDKKESSSSSESVKTAPYNNSPASQMPLLSRFFDLSHMGACGYLPDSLSLIQLKKKVNERVEREILLYVLNKTGWHRTDSARILQISYKTLIYKMKTLGIHPAGSSS